MLHVLKYPLSGTQLQTAFPQLITAIHGDVNFIVREFAPPEESLPTSLVFAHSPKALKELNHPVGIVVISPSQLKEKNVENAKCILVSPRPDWLMADFFNSALRKTPFRPEPSLHSPITSIASTAKIHPTATIGPFVSIGENVEIGEDVSVGANSVLEDGVKIGKATTIHPLVFIGHDCIIGEHCEIHPQTAVGKEGYGYAHNARGEHRRIPHLGNVVIGSHVHIGANCSIDRATINSTTIGDGTKIDNQCHIAHNCIIGKHCLITAHFVMAGSGEIGDHFICGGKTAVNGHIKVGNGVQVAAFSGVSRDVEKPGQYGGHPLQPLPEYLKMKAVSVHLPWIYKTLRDVVRTLEDKNILEKKDSK